MKSSWIKYLIAGIILAGIIIFSAVVIPNLVINKAPSFGPVNASMINPDMNASTPPSTPYKEIRQFRSIPEPLPAPLAAQSVEAIRQFANSPEMNASYTGTNPQSYADLYEFTSGNSHFTVNNITGRVQSAHWVEAESKDQKEVVDIDQGYKIAEQFAQEKYPEFWNVSSTRGIKDISKDMGKTLQVQLQYKWEEVYYTPDKNTTNRGEILGWNEVSVDVSPYTGHVTGYSEDYTPSVITGTPPVNLTPHITEEQAKKIAEDYFRTLNVGPFVWSTGPELVNLRITNDKNNLPHLEWNFRMTRIVQISIFDFYGHKKTTVVSIDAHDGTVLGSFTYCG